MVGEFQSIKADGKTLPELDRNFYQQIVQMYEQASKKKYQSQNVVSSKIRDSEPTSAIIYEKNQHK